MSHFQKETPTSSNLNMEYNKAPPGIRMNSYPNCSFSTIGKTITYLVLMAGLICVLLFDFS